MLEVTAVAVRSAPAVAVFAAAAVVLVWVSRDRRRLRREAVASRLMAGCAHRDNAALVAQLEMFRRRLHQAGAGPDLVPPSGGGGDLVADEDVHVSTLVDPPMEGGPV
jgi:hypothetical protein